MEYNMNNLTDAVKELALSLPDGCTDSHSACPDCGVKGSFNLTREDGQLKYICFRASCNFQGRIDSKTGKHLHALTPSRKVHLFNGRLECLIEQEIHFLVKKFNIKTDWLYAVRWSEDDNRVYYPQYDLSGRIVGYIARHYEELAGYPLGPYPKAIWKPVLSTQTGLCFPNMHILAMIREQKRVVLVEDYLSALRISSQLHIPTCCLGGTNLYDSMVSTLIGLGVEEVIIVLDADAVIQAIKMRRLLSLTIPNTVVVPLTGVDPKDMTIQELEDTFNKLIEE